MMNNEKNKRSDDILGSLDGSQKATAPAFFYTRLKARMEKELNKGQSRSWALRPAYALAALAMLVIINTAVVLQKDKTENVNVTTADTETVQSAAEYYSLNDNTIYDINPEK